MTSALTPLQSASTPLARELMPEAVAEMQAEITRLQRLLFVEPAFMEAVLEFVERERERVCTLWNGRAVTLHTVAENDPKAFAQVQVRMCRGDLTGLWLLCGFCSNPKCGGPEQCRRAGEEFLSPEETFEVQLPQYLFDAREKLIAARGMENE